MARASVRRDLGGDGKSGRNGSAHRVYDPGMPNFEPQFDPDDIGWWARRYAYADDTRMVEVIGPRTRARGYYTKADFLELVNWKARRVASRAAKNPASAIEEVTRVALGASTEELRIWVPQALSFVAWPIASVLLHFGHRDPYPILDFRALEALGVAKPAVYSMPFWLAYVDATRRLAAEHNVDMRTLDQALWQWSKEQGAQPNHDDET